MIEVNRNKGKETKSDIFSWGIFKKILRYFNDFQNGNFSVL